MVVWVPRVAEIIGSTPTWAPEWLDSEWLDDAYDSFRNQLTPAAQVSPAPEL